MVKSEIIDLLKTIPPILWSIFIYFLSTLFYKRIREKLLPKLGGIKAAGVEFS